MGYYATSHYIKLLSDIIIYNVIAQPTWPENDAPSPDFMKSAYT